MILKIGFLFTLIFSVGNVEAIPHHNAKNACQELTTLLRKEPRNMGGFTTKFFKKLQDTTDPELSKFVDLYKAVENASEGTGEQVCEKFLKDNLSKMGLEFAPVQAAITVVDMSRTHNSISELGRTQEAPKELKDAKSFQYAKRNQCSNEYRIECKNEFLIMPQSLNVLDQLGEKLLAEAKNPLEPYNQMNCDCLNTKIKESLDTKERILATAAGEIGEVDRLVTQAVGKKLINDYASLHEDINYYETTEATKMLNAGAAVVDEKSLCKDFKSFKKTIDAACKTAGIKNQDERIKEILGVYGNHFGAEESGFIEGFQNLLNDIDAPYSTAQNSKKNALYTRQMFNDARWHMNQLDIEKGQPEVIAVNDFVTKFIRTESLNSKISKMLETDPTLTPLSAIENLLRNNDDPEILNLISKIENPKSKILIQEWKNLLAADANTLKSSLFDTALKMSPGLKQALQNESLFTKASKNLKGKNSILEAIEENQLLSSHFADRCKAIEDNLANAVCTKPEEFKKKVSTLDLMNILESRQDNAVSNADAMSILLCNANRSQILPGSAFDHLTIDKSHRSFQTSDFSNKKENNKSTFFTNLANKTAHDPNFAENMSKISKESANQRISNTTLISSKAYRESSDYKPFSNDDFLNEVKKDFKISNNSSEKNQVPREEKSRQILPQSAQESMLAPIVPDFRAAAITKEIPIPAFQAAKPAAEAGPEVMSPRNELKKYLTNENPEKTKKHLENINEEDAKELLTLREQLSKSRDELSAVKLAQETAKFNDLKMQNEELQKRLEAVTKSGSIEPSRSFASAQGESSGFKSQNFTGLKDITSNDFEHRAATDRMGNADHIASSTGAQGSIRADASLSVAAAAAPSHEGDSALNRIIITSSSTDGNRGLQDPSIELINYLSKKVPDHKTLSELQELKESGMIYTYAVKDNGKEVKVTKLIKYHELSKEAKKIVDSKILILSQSDELKKQTRLYSYQALKLEIMRYKNN